MPAKMYEVWDGSKQKSVPKASYLYVALENQACWTVVLGLSGPNKGRLMCDNCFHEEIPARLAHTDLSDPDNWEVLKCSIDEFLVTFALDRNHLMISAPAAIHKH